MNEIEHLQLSAPRTHDAAVVARIHTKVEALIAGFPPALAVRARDPCFDGAHPHLRAQAELAACNAHIVLVGLHRPYVYAQQRSRAEIVRSGTAAIEAQTRLATCLGPHQQRLYTMNSLTFDPAVLVAAVLITAPLAFEQAAIEAALATLRKGAARLEENGKRVKLAEKGAVVLNLLIEKATVTAAEAARVRMACTRESPQSVDDVGPAAAGDSPSAAWVSPTQLQMPPGFGAESDMFAPINSSILDSRELDDILDSPEFGAMGEMNYQMPEGVYSGLEDEDTYWHNLLHMPL